MTGLSNFTSWFPPVPLPPVAPNFVSCHSAYGNGLSYLHQTAARLAGTLPQGDFPVQYTVNDEEAPYNFYDLPYQTHVGPIITITVDVTGPVDIRRIRLIPNTVRSMAAYVADRCIRDEGKGGFVTSGIENLTNFVTDPSSDLEAPIYPPNSAFITVSITNVQSANSFPGDNDPIMANFLRGAEEAALHTARPQDRDTFSRRIRKYAAQATRMTRLGMVSWWDASDGGRNMNLPAIS